MRLPIYLLVDFQNFKVRRPTILCYCPNLVRKHLFCCLKSTEFCPDFYHSFSIPSFCRVASKITIMLVYLPEFIFHAMVSHVNGRFVHGLYTWKKNYLRTWMKTAILLLLLLLHFFYFIKYDVKYYYFLPGEFSAPALADSLSLESEWLYVSSDPQDSSQYSGQFQHSYSLEGFNSSSDFQLFQPPFQLFQPPFQVFGYRSKRSYYKWYHCHLHVPQLP